MSPTFTTPKRPLTWLITGCSSGFGLELARMVQAGGHKLIATSRNPSKTPDLVSEIEGKGGKWIKLDVDDANNSKAIENLEASGEQIDILVNNAGFSIHNCVETLKESEVRALMETNYFGPYRLMRAALPHMRKRRFGVVVNMSSGAGLEGRESMGGYAAAKSAIDGISKVLAKEVADFNIRVIIVSLGAFNTNMPNAVVMGETPVPEDYQDKVLGKFMKALDSRQWVPGGDKTKAMRAVYEVTLGEGVGAGHEAEKFLPLGQDLAVRIKDVQDYYNHGMEVFGDVCKSVQRDEKA